MKLAILAIVSIGLAMQAAPAGTPIDPVGNWSFSTVDDTGKPTTGVFEISGAPGAYTGQGVAADGTTVQLMDLMTSPKAVMMVVQLPGNSGLAFVRLTKDTEGKLTGQWGPVAQVAPITLTRTIK